jgi:predicted RNA binding protein YcfA (HicA-like mRNA interferase family)
MKLPRDVTGNDLAKALCKLGYHVTRQTGSHIRLSTKENGEQHHSTRSQSLEDWYPCGNSIRH